MKNKCTTQLRFSLTWNCALFYLQTGKKCTITTTWTLPKVQQTFKENTIQPEILFLRGCENIEKMLKNDFQLKYSIENEEWFVIKICDELTKNHCNLENIVTGTMPENKTDPLCPVRSFTEYISHLYPENKYMWQYPVNKIDPQYPEIWFTRKNIGKNPLASFMSDVSRNCNLS